MKTLVILTVLFLALVAATAPTRPPVGGVVDGTGELVPSEADIQARIDAVRARHQAPLGLRSPPQKAQPARKGK